MSSVTMITFPGSVQAPRNSTTFGWYTFRMMVTSWRNIFSWRSVRSWLDGTFAATSCPLHRAGKMENRIKKNIKKVGRIFFFFANLCKLCRKRLFTDETVEGDFGGGDFDRLVDVAAGLLVRDFLAGLFLDRRLSPRRGASSPSCCGASSSPTHRNRPTPVTFPEAWRLSLSSSSSERSQLPQCRTRTRLRTRPSTPLEAPPLSVSYATPSRPAWQSPRSLYPTAPLCASSERERERENFQFSIFFFRLSVFHFQKLGVD